MFNILVCDPSIQFYCHSGDNCISEDLTCDGKEDCDEGEDEYDCPEGIYK